MTTARSSSILSQVIAGLIVAAIIGLIAFLPGAFKWLSSIVSGILSHLRSTSELPNWSLYLLLSISSHSFIKIILSLKQHKGPSVTSYSKDFFLGVTWRWSYISGRPINAWAFCPHCDTVLVYSQVGSRFDPDKKVILSCETCNIDLLHHDGDKDYLVQKIHRQIDRKIRNNDWLTVINQPP
ncbi:MAG: hypothetical protein WA173_11470 [Pseudomonas sp.]|uniref:hypothetical protein n=1 Tax=Pseudomonas sp. TaxID=306 RepID=UPI003BB6B26A